MGRDGLGNYDIQVHSLATGLIQSSKVAGIMFNLRPEEEEPEETIPRLSGNEFNQNDENPRAKMTNMKKRKRKGEAPSRRSRASTFRDPNALGPGPEQPAASASGQPDLFIEMVARVKDGLVLDDNFFGMTPLVDIRLDDYEFE